MFALYKFVPYVYVRGCLYMNAYVCLAVDVSVAALAHALELFLQDVFY